MSERAHPTPREWVGDASYPWPPAHSLADGARQRACYCILDLQLARTRQDQVFLRLDLGDRHGAVSARLWNDVEAIAPLLRAGMHVGVDAHVEIFNGEVQLAVEAIAPVHVDLEHLELFLPSSSRSAAEMEAQLGALISSVADPAFRALLERMLGANSELGQGFRLAPAAKYNHHAMLGGLLEHTLSVASVCDRLAQHYGPEIDRDLLVAGALLHDIGKVREIGARAGFPYTDEGKLLGHILLGLQMIHDAAQHVPTLTPTRLLLLEHLVAAHQGRFEWQSPREPSTLEALVLHYADDLDAKLQQVRELLGRADGPWSEWSRSFRREFLRHAAPAPPEPPPGPVSRRRPPRNDRRTDAPPASDKPLTGFQRLSDDTLDLFGDA